jgi:hypothetical protein
LRVRVLIAVSLFVVAHQAAARAQTDTGTIRVRFSGGSDGPVNSILDTRFDKEVRLGALRVRFGLEGYNLLGTANEVEEDVVTGPGFRRSTARQPPRVLRLVFRLTWINQS